MRRKIQFSVLSIKLLACAIFFGMVMCVINSLISYREFKKQIENLYGDVTRQFAETAITYIDADRIYNWLTEGSDGSWDSTNARLNELTETAMIAYIYVTVVDSNYSSRTYVFDTVHSMAYNQEIFPLGYVESLEKKDSDYIENLRHVIEDGESTSIYKYKRNGGHVTTSVPMRDFTGKIVAVMSVVKSMDEIKEYKNNYIFALSVAAIVFTLIFISIYASSLYMGLVKPLMLIIEETSNFASHHGELSGSLKKIKSRDELGILAHSIEKMSTDMNKYINELTKTTAEKERLGAELNVATKIQSEMLPRVFPPYKNHPELELFASMTPAKAVGGDFYDFYMLDENRFAVVVADVSGKGVPAALFMVIAKTLLKDAAFQYSTPAEVFNHVNNILCEGNDSGLFVTCWMAFLELSTGKIHFSNAGHTPPVLLKDGKVSYLEVKPNLMLAAMPSVKYTDYELEINADDRLFIYTDGVTEASNSQNELYGGERLLNVLNKSTGLSSKEVISFVRKDIDSFVQNAPQFDDITMLEMVLKAKKTSKKSIEMTINADDKNMQEVNDFIHSCLPEDCSEVLLNKIDLAVEEIFVNIAHYAYNPEVGQAKISASFENNVLTVIFKDNGKEFNPIAKEDPDITLDADSREIGGLGIFLTKKFMDNVDYEYKNNQNILTIRKKIE
ncbi:SpoIIE family protein phosphatase [Treponema sp.]|uniref:SpoIIE family protein phosphatase n=1 Tax=Treponema sp. TaxID=166 RepID=UPI00388CF83B